MLNNLFPNFFGSNENGKSALSTGGNPGQINGADRERLANASQLSDTPTKESVFRLAENTGILEASTHLLKHESEQKLKQQDVALANLEVRVNHAEQSFQKTKKYQQTMSKHGKNILNHQIDEEVVTRNLDGYQQALQTAESKIHL